jgi:HD superfamily phosphohydrolase YqeK
MNNVESLKSKFLVKTCAIERQGINDLLNWLDTSDFFTAPCSTEFHLAKPEGLLEHSLNVYTLLLEKCERYQLDEYSLETITICGLFHDLCKANFYVKGFKNVKLPNGQWDKKEVWEVKDQVPLGHGEKSAMILQNFIKLTEEEQMAIRWHMGPWTPGAIENYAQKKSYEAAVNVSTLVSLLFAADYEATRLLELG